MNLELCTKVAILMWPLLLAFAVLNSLFLPDRARRLAPAGADRFVGGVWALVALWLIPLTILLSAPHGDVFSITPAPIEAVFSEAVAHLTAPMLVTGLVVYGCVGFGWAITYFYLYARRLGVQYVMERDLWLRSHDRATLAELTPALREDFESKVLGKVRAGMLYDGDFPLRPLQQKRFFGANVALWPATLLCYLIGDMALDVARQVWFAFRAWVHRYWEHGMAEHLADGEMLKNFLDHHEVAGKSKSSK